MFEKVLVDFEQTGDPAPAGWPSALPAGINGCRARSTPAARAARCIPSFSSAKLFQGVSEAERLEFLVHEMGHYLGAVHTPDINSVMRPVLGDRRARAKSFRIGFDGPNTLIMNLIVENLRAHPVANLFQLSPEIIGPLATAYGFYARAMPKDASPRPGTWPCSASTSSCFAEDRMPRSTAPRARPAASEGPTPSRR